jgi:hypothetical protein
VKRPFFTAKAMEAREIDNWHAYLDYAEKVRSAFAECLHQLFG